MTLGDTADICILTLHYYEAPGGAALSARGSLLLSVDWQTDRNQTDCTLKQRTGRLFDLSAASVTLETRGPQKGKNNVKNVFLLGWVFFFVCHQLYLLEGYNFSRQMPWGLVTQMKWNKIYIFVKWNVTTDGYLSFSCCCFFSCFNSGSMGQIRPAGHQLIITDQDTY